jgi:hypothetical protein
MLEPFPGYPAFLEAAAAELNCPEAAGPARRVSTLTAMANLCAQAAVAETGAVAGILAKAEEFRDQLRVATRAAELMLASVRITRRTQSLASQTEPPRDHASQPHGVVERGRTIPRPNSQRPTKGRSHS